MNEEQTANDKPRTYTWTFEDGKTVTRTAEELTDEQIYALERLNALTLQIGRMNGEVNDATVLREHYAIIALPAFQEKDEEEEEKAEDKVEA